MARYGDDYGRRGIRGGYHPRHGFFQADFPRDALRGRGGRPRGGSHGGGYEGAGRSGASEFPGYQGRGMPGTWTHFGSGHGRGGWVEEQWRSRLEQGGGRGYTGDYRGSRTAYGRDYRGGRGRGPGW